MSPERKPDADAFAAKIAELRKSFTDYRKNWPRFIYHSAALSNAASILNQGKLLSRYQAQQTGFLQEDSAAPGIIAGLTDEQKDWVRFYFRPRAPTQYANEGIRPIAHIEYKAHMAVPVFLAFSAKTVLALKDTYFTTGRNLPTTLRHSPIEFSEHLLPVGPPGAG